MRISDWSSDVCSSDLLARTVLPDVNLATNRWLFQHLTQTLDRRVLKLLSRADDTDLHAAISINLNVETLLSPAFLEFDASLRMGSRGTIVVERSEEHTSELQSLMRLSYAVFCLKKKTKK